MAVVAGGGCGEGTGAAFDAAAVVVDPAASPVGAGDAAAAVDDEDPRRTSL